MRLLNDDPSSAGNGLGVEGREQVNLGGRHGVRCRCGLAVSDFRETKGESRIGAERNAIETDFLHRM